MYADSLAITQIGIGVDEINITQGFITSEQVLERFNNTKPRLQSLGIQSGSILPYHQSRITVYATGSQEVEIYQFSILPFITPFWVVGNKNRVDIFRIPIYSLNSALQYLGNVTTP